jgi:hypothetical protein
VSRLLIEPSLPFGPKFASAPAGTVELHFVALCHSALNLTDGFVSAAQVYGFFKARKPQINRMIEHLVTVQPGCASPSWEVRPGGWFLHDYDDPLYMNPLREDVANHARTRREASAKGGKRSVAIRRERYGSAQPITPPSLSASNSAPEVTPEVTFEASTSGTPEPKSKQVLREPSNRSRSRSPNLPALRSTNTDVHGVEENVLTKHGDVDKEMVNGSSARVGAQILVGRLLDWLCVTHAWSSISRDTFMHEEAIAKKIAALGTPWSDLQPALDAMWKQTDPDERPSTLGYFWTRLQDQQHAALKAPRSHVNTAGPSKIVPVMPG